CQPTRGRGRESALPDGLDTGERSIVSCRSRRARRRGSPEPMCRVLAYLGEPVLLDDLLYKPDSSLVKQSYDPKMLHMLNRAGLGLCAWDGRLFDPDTPLLYKSATLPVFDANLKNLAQKIQPRCLLAHVRGVAYHSRVNIGEHNLHPFKYDDFRLALAHNGDLHRFSEMKFLL